MNPYLYPETKELHSPNVYPVISYHYHIASIRFVTKDVLVKSYFYNAMRKITFRII